MSEIRMLAQRGNAGVDGQHQLLFQAWSCAFAELPVTYLSGPITTGLRFVQWYRENGRRLMNDPLAFRAARQQAVIDPNEQDLRDAARRLRLELREPVVEPASLRIADWSQDEYIALWEEFIERHAGKVIMMPGWEFSTGCAAEFLRAWERNIPIYNTDGRAITLAEASRQLSDAAATLDQLNVPTAGVAEAASKLASYHARTVRSGGSDRGEHLRKDASLDRLADTVNVAQFVSFEPNGGPRQAYSRVLGYEPNHSFRDARSAIQALLRTSPERSVNVRSFTPESPLSREFIYGLSSVDDAVAAVQRLSAQGLYTIVNETVDVKDGGVSGVLMGDVIEFAPDDTPRCVEKPGTASLPRALGIDLLSTVYRFTPDMNVPFAARLEFSLHPRPRGWMNTHTLGWECASVDPVDIGPKLDWPNRFSRMIGDKVFGLLIAHNVGLPVPRTTVINRRVAPFSFGRPTGLAEVWLRTSPVEQVPGKFTTTRGWIDPFRLVAEEDPNQSIVASVIAQAAVRSEFSGAVVFTSDGKLVVEGKRGEGESLMRGEANPEELPNQIVDDVRYAFAQARSALGPVRFEWVHDGREVWIVQLHRGATQSTREVLVPGAAEHWKIFDVSEGLERLREVVASVRPGEGLLLKGSVGLTSHVADVIRRANVPARMAA